ncbi:MAG: hypothetical protein RLZZ230_843 [Candidatus Parcubacteria bacterium]|jgi:peptidoglycan hydrolase-like protein with peptidoglycan-binding domain
MNTLTFINRILNARFLAATVVASLLLSAFPVTFLVAEAFVQENIQCIEGVNLLTNGSFESPTIENSEGWDIFDSVVNGLAWAVEWVNPSIEAPEIAKLELQGNFYGVSDGLQYAELDTNWYIAPGLEKYSGEDTRVKIYQTIATIPGQEYEFKFDFSALPNSGPDNNIIKVLVDDVVIGTQTASGIGKVNNEWISYSYVFIATTTTTKVGLADAGTVDSFGTLVDNVSLTCKPKIVEEKYRIEGFKYKIDNESESPLANWTVNLKNSDGKIITSTTTDVSGYYYFEVEAGSYKVYESMQTEWNQVKVLRDDYQTETEGEGYCAFDIPVSETDYTCDFYNQYVGISSPEQTIEKKGHNQSTGTRIKRPAPKVLGASTSNTCPLIKEYMQKGWNNNPFEVTKLQMFLNSFKDTYGGVENPITGFFGPVTKANVETFQKSYSVDVLNPWFDKGIVPHSRPTGFVYKTTMWKINSIVCAGYKDIPSFEGENLTTNTAIN